MNKYNNTLRDYSIMMTGSLVGAVGINIMAGKNLAFGGVSGLAIVLGAITGISLPTLNLIINIPLFLLGMRYIGKKFLVRSLFSTAMLSAFLDLTAIVQKCQIDLVIATIFGGILLGIGVGIIAKSGGSTGGTDMLALILGHHTNKPLGNYMFFIDGTIIILGGITFGLNKALYSILVVFFISRAVNEAMKRYDEIMPKKFLLFKNRPASL